MAAADGDSSTKAAKLAPLVRLAVALQSPSQGLEFHSPNPDRTGRVAIRWDTGVDSKPNCAGESYPLAFNVSVEPVDIEFRAERDAFVEALRSVWRIADLADDLERARVSADRSRLAMRAANERLALVLERRPAGSVMGPAEVRPDRGQAGELRRPWHGPVWLVDPVKRWSGLGFRYESIADLWASHPYLRPTSAGHDEDGPWMRVEYQPIGEVDGG